MKRRDFNNLIILRLELTPLGENEVADGTVVTFTDEHYGGEIAEGFALTVPVSEWHALGSSRELYFTASTRQLGVSRENWVILPEGSAPLVCRKGVVNGHITEVWVRDEVPVEQAIETPAAGHKRLVFDLTTRDVLKIKELTLPGVIDGKIARGEYTEVDG